MYFPGEVDENISDSSDEESDEDWDDSDEEEENDSPYAFENVQGGKQSRLLLNLFTTN